MAVFYLILALLGLYWLYSVFKKKDTWLVGIPGPKGIPYFGNLHQLDFTKPHICISEWAKQYGSVFKLNLAGQPVIVVNGYNSIYQVLVSKGKHFSSRPETFRMKTMTADFSEIAFSDLTPKKIFLKKMFSSHVKQYGSGLAKIEEIVVSTIQNAITDVKCHLKEKMNVKEFVKQIVINITYVMTFGYEPDQDDMKKISDVIDYHAVVLTVGGSGEFLDLFPWLRYFGHPVWKQLVQMGQLRSEQYLKWKMTVMSKRKEGQDLSQNFLNKLLKAVDEDKDHGLNDFHADVITWDMFLGGVTTTTSVVTAMFNILIHHPNVQKKLQIESTKVLGEKVPSFQDRNDLPYHQATVRELLRQVFCWCHPHPHPHHCLLFILTVKIR